MAGKIKISPISSLNFNNSWVDKYTQSFGIEDIIRIQYTVSSGRRVSAKLINENGDTDISSSLLQSGEDNQTYDLQISAAQRSYGLNHLQLSIGGTVEAEAFFCVRSEECLSDTLILHYSNYQDDSTDIFWRGDNQIFFDYRIEGDFLPAGLTPSVDNEEFRDTTYDLMQLSAFPYDVETLTVGRNDDMSIGGVPNWVGQKLNRIFSLSEVYIGNQQYVRSGGSVPENIGSMSVQNDLFIYTIDLEKYGEPIEQIEKSPWVVVDGFWNDDYMWIDTEFWNDGQVVSPVMISGEIIDQATQSPLSAVSVTVSVPSGIIGSTQTNSAGEYSLPWHVSELVYPSGATMNFKFSKTGYNAFEEDVSIPESYDAAVASGVKLDGTLTQAVSGDSINIFGSVKNTKGDSVGGAIVQAYIGEAFIGTSPTDIFGNFRIAWKTDKQNYDNLYRGGLKVSVTADGYQETEIDRRLTGDYDNDLANGIEASVIITRTTNTIRIFGTIKDRAYPSTVINGNAVYVYNQASQIMFGIPISNGSFEKLWEVDEGTYNEAITLMFKTEVAGYKWSPLSYFGYPYHTAVEIGIEYNEQLDRE